MAFDDVIPWGWGRKGREGREGREGRVPSVSDLPVGSLHREMNRLFDDFFSDFGVVQPSARSLKAGGFNPQVDVIENEKEITVTAEVPGLEEKDIDLNLSRDALTLRGQKRYEREEKDEGFLYRERSFGGFERTIPLNVEIDSDRVEAKFKNGVVTVILPKTKESQNQVRKISVKSA